MKETMEEPVKALRKRVGSVTTTVFTKMLYDKDPDTLRNAGSWVIGLTIMDRNPGLETLRNDVMEKLVKKYVRFRSTLRINRRGYSVFEEISEELDMSYHMPDLTLKTKGWSREDLLEYVGELNEFPYDLTRPLWRYLLVPELNDGTSALISCVNHAIGDGLSLVAVTEELYDPMPVSDGSPAKEFKHQGKKPVVKKMDKWSQLGVFLYGIYHGLTITLTRPDPPNILRMPKGAKPIGKKVIALADPIDLNRVKEIKNKMEGTTINDVVMGLMTMTLKAFFIEEGTYKKGEKVTAQFPISMRGVGEGAMDDFNEPHNKISYAYFGFDFEGDRETIIWKTKHQIDCIKLSPSPLLIDWNVRLGMKLLPHRLMMDLTRDVANLGSAQLSNVPAPQAEVSMFNGCKVIDFSFYLFSPLACYLGILTYNGVLNAAFNLDSGLKVDPKKLANHWNREFELLYEEIMKKAGSGTLPEPKHDTTFYKRLAQGTVALLIGLFTYILLLRNDTANVLK